MTPHTRPTPALVRAVLNNGDRPLTDAECAAINELIAARPVTPSALGLFYAVLAAHIRACEAEMREESNRHEIKGNPFAGFVLRRAADRLEGKEAKP